MKRILLGLTLMLSLASAAAQEACPQVGGTATIAQWSEPGNLNPLIFPTTYDRNIQELVFASLIRTTSDLSFEPDLAESWQVSDDQRTITFTLREGLVWHDGEPLTAQDVAFTFSAMAHPQYDGGRFAEISVLEGAEAVRSGEADAVAGIEVIDDTTIAFTTTEPFAPFLPVIAGVFILPEHVYGEVPFERWQQDVTNREPLGAGPFEFVQYRPNELVEVRANEAYHAGRPCLDRIIVRFGDQNTMLAALLSGEVDVAQVPIASVASVEGQENIELNVVDSLSFQYLGTNLRHPALAEEAVRRAMAHAINRQAIVDGLLRGYGTTLDSVFPPNHWSYPDDIESIQYDPELAEQLLDEAGWVREGEVRRKDGETLSFTLYYPTGNQIRERSAPIIQANFRAVGIGLELQAMDFPTLVTHLLPADEQGNPRQVRVGDFDLFLLGYGITRDPNEYLSYFIESDMPPNGYNFTGYTEPQGGELLLQGRVTLDQEERAEVYREFARLMRQELPWIPLYQQQDLYAHNTRLNGFSPDIRGVNPNVTRWWLEP